MASTVFIGREEELDYFSNLTAESGAKILVIYGRRALCLLMEAVYVARSAAAQDLFADCQ